MIKDATKRPYLSDLIFDFEIFFAKLLLSNISDQTSQKYKDLEKELKNWERWKEVSLEK